MVQSAVWQKLHKSTNSAEHEGGDFDTAAAIVTGTDVYSSIVFVLVD